MNYYDGIAEGYNELHKEEQLPKLIRILDGLNVSDADSVLDVGCGTAFSFELLHPIGCRYQGAEPSKELINQSKYPAKITNCGAEDLPFPDDLFTVVISVTCLQNFENPLEGLMEMKRVCSDRLAISFLKTSERRKEFEDVIRDVFVVSSEVEEDRDIIFFCTVLKNDS